MIDKETVKKGAEALATAIGELMEDAAPAALQRPPKGLIGYRNLAPRLRTAGDDIAILAAALEVLARQDE